MVPIRADLQERDLIALGDLQTDLCQHRVHRSIEDDTAVLGWTDQMIDQD